MDTHDEKDIPWSTQVTGNVHVNPRFAVRPHFNKDFRPVVNAAPHINPHFMHTHMLQRSLLNSLESAVDTQHDISGTFYPNEYPVSSHYVAPLIHINPNVLQISNFVKQDVPVVEQIQNSKYILHSKNKIIRNNLPTNLQSAVKTLPTAVVVPVVPKKPSYSFIRKTNVKPTLETKPKLYCTKTGYKENSYDNSKPSSSKYPPRGLHNRVWKRKSISNSGPGNSSGMSNALKHNSRFSFNKSSSSQINESVISTRSLLKQKAQFVFIHGEKYIVNNNILKRVVCAGQKINKDNVSTKTKGINVIRVSGVTYVRKSNNMFAVDNRKKNSMKKLKKMNVPCPVYRRYGKCAKHNTGKCALVHDRKHVTVCSKFLKGVCEIDDCNLSHEVVPEKMPTCRYFLDGCCVRQSCPYLHVKLNDGAKVCSKFVQGYCADGDKCNNKHINVCPDFYNTGKCVKLKCPYPHKNIEERRPLRPLELSAYDSKMSGHRIAESSIGKDNFKTIANEVKSRYFEGSSKVSLLTNVSISSKTEGSVPEDSEESVNFLNRPKLGKLPSFISLE